MNAVFLLIIFTAFITTAWHQLTWIASPDTSSVTLLPTGVIALRASAGSADPAGIVATTLFATICSTAAAIIAAKTYQRFSALPSTPIVSLRRAITRFRKYALGIKQNVVEFTLKQASMFLRRMLLFILLPGYPLGQALAGTQPSALEQAQNAFFSQNYSLAEQRLVPIAKQGHAGAQYYLGLVYQANQNPNDDKLSIGLWRQAAQQQHPLAMQELGQAYELGRFVEKDLLIAIDWYRKAKQVEAPTDRVYLEEGQDSLIELSSKQIVQKWLQKAKNGDKEAPFRLAQLYDQYNQSDQAFIWYKAAAEQGHQYAQLMLGYFYCRGIYTTPDVTRANLWLERSKRTASCRA